MSEERRIRKRDNMEGAIKEKLSEQPYSLQGERGIIDPVYNTILAIIPPWKSYNRILDIGCNFGEFTNRIYNKFEPEELFAFDFTPSSIDYAKETYPDIDFSVEDVCDFSTEKKFDLIMASGVLNLNWLEINEYKNVIRKIKGWLNDGGYFVEQNNFASIDDKQLEMFSIAEKEFDLVIHLDFYKYKPYVPEDVRGHSSKYRWVRLYEHGGY